MNKFSLIIAIVLFSIGTQALFGCPYTFINDSKNQKIFLGQTITHGQLIEPGEKITVDAPMNPEHKQQHEAHGTNHGEHKDAGDDNGHAPIYVYAEEKRKLIGSDESGNTGMRFTLEYKIRERACGKNSVLKFSELQKITSEDESQLGRFGVKKMTEERAERKVGKLATFGSDEK